MKLEDYIQLTSYGSSLISLRINQPCVVRIYAKCILVNAWNLDNFFAISEKYFGRKIRISSAVKVAILPYN